MATLQVDKKKYSLTIRTRSTPNIAYDKTNFTKFMAAYSNPISNPISSDLVWDTGPPRAGGASAGGVYIGDGIVVFPPFISNIIGIYNIYTRVYQEYSCPTSNFRAAMLAPDGTVLFFASLDRPIGIYYPKEHTYVDGPYIADGARKGILAPNGDIVLIPWDPTSPIRIYDWKTQTVRDGPFGGPNRYYGGALAGDGKIYLFPSDQGQVGIYDPITEVFTEGAFIQSSGGGYAGATLTLDGRIVVIPSDNSYIGIYDPETDVFSIGPDVLNPNNEGKFSEGGVLLPDGRIVFSPYKSIIGVYDPALNTYSETPFLAMSSEYYGRAILVPNGEIISPPNSETLPIGITTCLGLEIPEGYCMHPYLQA